VAISNPIELAAEIVTAFVSHNSVPRGELSALFETVHAAVRRLGDGTEIALAAIDCQGGTSPGTRIGDCPEIGGIKPPSPIVGMAGRLD
jgi:hypothetical protein